MAKNNNVPFIVSGTLVRNYTGTSDFTTDSLTIFLTTSYKWVLYADSTHTTGNPEVTVQCSGNGSNWFNYKSLAVGVLIPDVIIDEEFFPKYMRVKYVANGSDGTVTLEIGTL